MRLHILLLLLFSLKASIVVSQQDSSSNLPTAGYDYEEFNGFFIRSQDAKLTLRLGAFTQFRYNMNFMENTPDTVNSLTQGFNINLTRIFMEGEVGNRLGYYFLTQINDDGSVELVMAFMSYKFRNNSELWFGKMFMAVGREDWAWTQNLMAQDFSANDQVFALGTNFGLQWHNVVSDKFRFWLSASNGAFGSEQSFPFIEESDVLLAGRFGFNFVGPWENWEDMVGRQDRPFGVLLGIGPAVQFNGKTNTTPGYTAGELNVDLSVNGDGYHAMVQGFMANKKLDGTDRFQNYGIYAAGGYWLNHVLLGYLRMDVVWPGNQPGDYETYAAPGLGFSYYPFQHSNRWRISLEYNYLGANIDNTIVAADAALGFISPSYGGQSSLRLQAEFGF